MIRKNLLFLGNNKTIVIFQSLHSGKDPTKIDVSGLSSPELKPKQAAGAGLTAESGNT